jgi:ubiquinone/menaquinone biosynthesis C-methylase UbiE
MIVMVFRHFHDNLVDFKRLFIEGRYRLSRYAATYAEKAERHALNEASREELDWVISRKQEAEYVLDLGCNTGIPLKKLCQAWHSRGSGLDVNIQALEKARQTLPELDFFHLQGERFPFEDASFDHVACHHVIGHVPCPEKTLAEIYRILKTKGTLSIITPNRLYKFWQMPFNLLHDFAPDSSVLRYYSPSSLHYLLKKASFQLQNMETFGAFPKVCPPLFQGDSRLRLMLWAFKKPFVPAEND